MNLLLVPVAATALALAGCSSAGDTPAAPLPTTPPAAAAPTSSASAPASSAATAIRVEASVAGGVVTTAQQVVDVPLGSAVLLVVTSDKADELHVHGYDKEAELAAGKATELRFDATIPGVFEVETHSGHQRLVQLRVR
jgi:hypothetical protein